LVKSGAAKALDCLDEKWYQIEAVFRRGNRPQRKTITAWRAAMSREPNRTILEAQYVLTTGVLTKCHDSSLQQWVEANKEQREALRQLLDAGPEMLCEVRDLATRLKMPRNSEVASIKAKLLRQKKTYIAGSNIKSDLAMFYGPDVTIEMYLDALQTFPTVLDSPEKPFTVCGMADVLSCYKLRGAIPDGSPYETKIPEWLRLPVSVEQGDDNGPLWPMKSGTRIACVEEVLDWFLDQAIRETIRIPDPLYTISKFWLSRSRASDDGERSCLIVTSTSIEWGERRAPMCVLVHLPEQADQRIGIRLACWVSFRNIQPERMFAMIVPKKPQHVFHRPS